jgi:hypothetical protein
MVTLVLKEITRNNAPERIDTALQRVVYLLLQLKEYQLEDNVRHNFENPIDALFFCAFFDSKRKFVGTFFDLISRIKSLSPVFTTPDASHPIPGSRHQSPYPRPMDSA